jgi:hypothetical protein
VRPASAYKRIASLFGITVRVLSGRDDRARLGGFLRITRAPADEPSSGAVQLRPRLSKSERQRASGNSWVRPDGHRKKRAEA